MAPSRLLLPLFRAFLQCAALGAAATDALGSDFEYDWRPLKIGGTGWVTGMVSHPTDPDVRLARTDVGGFYRWDSPSAAWEQLLTADRFPDVAGWEASVGVESIALAASDPNTFYVAARNRLYRSIDGGASFEAIGPSSLAMDPNGDARYDGERLAVDPLNAQIALFGSRSAGVLRTVNGVDWNPSSGVSGPVGTPGLGVSIVKFDPSSPRIGAGTSGAYAATIGGGVFRSTDGGASWTSLGALAGAPAATARASDLEIAPDGSIFVTFEGEGATGLWGYRPGASWGSGGSDWRQLPVAAGSPLTTVAVDPRDPARILTATPGTQELWLSEDRGETWRTLSWSRRSPDIPWAEVTNESWFSTGEIYFDPTAPGRVRVAQGIGAWFADLSAAATADDSVVWEFDSAGIEELVANDILPLPGRPVLTFGWDRTGFRHPEPDSYSATQALPQKFSHGWDGAYRPNNPDYVVTNSADDFAGRGALNNAAYSTDGGRTWELFESIRAGRHPEGLKFGAIAAGVSSAAYPSSLVWAPAGGAPPFFSTDGGANWAPATGWPTTPEGGPVDTGLINPYIKYQGLAADPHRAGAYYMMLVNHGVARSTDGGATWSLVSDPLPQYGFNARLLPDPYVNGVVYYAHGQQDDVPVRSGLWVSTDGAETFTPLPGVSYAIDVAVGAPAPGSTAGALYLIGVVEGREGIFRSTDAGQTWDSLGHYPLGVIDRPVRIAASLDEFGLVYIGFGGTGFAYGRPLALSPPGDYDRDGDVDPTDYAVWRAAYGGVSGQSLNADGNGDGVVNAADYAVWRDAHAGAAPRTVPEPPTALMIMTAAVGGRRRAASSSAARDQDLVER